MVSFSIERVGAVWHVIMYAPTCPEGRSVYRTTSQAEADAYIDRAYQHQREHA